MFMAFAYVIPIVKQDDSAVAAAVIDALKHEPSTTIAITNDIAPRRAKS